MTPGTPFDGVYVFSPSGHIFNHEAYHRGVAWLTQRFGRVEQSTHALAHVERFAGTEADRMEGIYAMERLPGRQLIMASRGGYGLSRLLNHLDLPRLAQYLNESGSVLCGHSDVTALQLALLNAGCQPGRLLHGPMLSFDFGAETPNPDMLNWFESSLAGQPWQVAWEDPQPVTTPSTPLKATGPLWGGNLAMVCSLIGTPYLPTRATQGGILFVEDVNEHPYRIERLLLQLLHSGVIARQSAVVLGQFNDWTPSPIDNGYDLRSAVEYVRSQTNVPVITGLAFGHVHRKLSLPIGSEVQLALEGNQVELIIPAL